MIEVRRFAPGKAVGLGVLVSCDNFRGVSIVLGVIEVNIGQRLPKRDLASYLHDPSVPREDYDLEKAGFSDRG